MPFYNWIKNNCLEGAWIYQLSGICTGSPFCYYKQHHSERLYLCFACLLFDFYLFIWDSAFYWVVASLWFFILLHQPMLRKCPAPLPVLCGHISLHLRNYSTTFHCDGGIILGFCLQYTGPTSRQPHPHLWGALCSWDSVDLCTQRRLLRHTSIARPNFPLDPGRPEEERVNDPMPCSPSWVTCPKKKLRLGSQTWAFQAGIAVPLDPSANMETRVCISPNVRNPPSFKIHQWTWNHPQRMPCHSDTSHTMTIDLRRAKSTGLSNWHPSGPDTMTGTWPGSCLLKRKLPGHYDGPCNNCMESTSYMLRGKSLGLMFWVHRKTGGNP